LLTDTVGFIRKLPHKLVDAFKATLEEVVNADLLVHVVDISHPRAHDQIQAVNVVLGEIGAAQKPMLMVFNKIDKLAEPEKLARFREEYPKSVAVSATTGEGFPELLQELGLQLRPIRDFVELAVPQADAAFISRLHEVGEITERRYLSGKVRLKVRIPPYLRPEIAAYWVRDLAKPGEATNT
jgi:GTP-binding protein HflX